MRPTTARVVTALATVALTVLATPGAASADAAGPTDYRSEVVSVSPETESIVVSIVGGDAFVRLRVEPGHEAIVLGYDDEPYLRIGPDGTVEQNRLSFATYYNEERYGGTDIPGIVDNAAAPEWERIGGGGAWAWHDHRAHWMGDDPPIGLEPGDSLPSQRIPIVVDGSTVDVEVRTTLLDGPSMWPAVFGILVGLQLALVAVLLGRASTTFAALVFGVAALIVGVVQYRSLPGETGPLVTWWLLPAIAVACAVTTIGIYGRSVLAESGLVALAALQVLLWAVLRRTTLTRAVLPTDTPFWLDRAVTAGVLVGSAVLLIAVLRGLFRPAAPVPEGHDGPAGSHDAAPTSASPAQSAAANS